MTKHHLFVLAALVAIVPEAVVAQTYNYYFDSGPVDHGSVAPPPIQSVVVSLSSSTLLSFPNSTTSTCTTSVDLKGIAVSISPSGSGYSVTDIKGCNYKGQGILYFTFRGPSSETFYGSAIASGAFSGVNSSTNMQFSFSDPTNGVAEYWTNATFTITNLTLPIVEWCEICQILLTLHPTGDPSFSRETEVQVTFVNLGGQQVGPTESVNIVSGQVTYLEIQPGQLGNIGLHMDLIPVITFNGNLPAPPLQVTAEVFDLNGLGAQFATDSFYTPASELAPQSITSGQVMRLVAQATTPNPCVAILGFSNAHGALVGPSLPVNLSPGQAQSIDLDATMLPLSGNQRAVILPMAQMPPAAAGGAGSACSVTSEVFDARTGGPRTYQNALLQ